MRGFAITWLLSVAALLASGCGGGSSSIDAATEGSEFKSLTLAYMQFLNSNKRRPPKSLDEFKQYVAKQNQALLESSGRSLESLFVSPRDGQPHVFITQDNWKQGQLDLVGYEQLGLEGMRYVGDRTGAVWQVDEAEFSTLVAQSG